MGTLLLISLVFDILRYAIGSMFLGVLFTILGVGLLFFLIKGFYPKSAFTPVSFIVGFILFFLLSFQSVFICGAFKVKSMAADIEVSINQYIPSSWKLSNQEISADDSQQIVENLDKEYPLFGCYIGWADFHGHTAANVAAAMVDEMHSFLNKFIWRRVGWSLLFIVLGTFIVIKTLDTYYGMTGKKRAPAKRNRRNNDF